MEMLKKKKKLGVIFMKFQKISGEFSFTLGKHRGVTSEEFTEISEFYGNEQEIRRIFIKFWKIMCS